MELNQTKRTYSDSSNYSSLECSGHSELNYSALNHGNKEEYGKLVQPNTDLNTNAIKTSRNVGRKATNTSLEYRSNESNL